MVPIQRIAFSRRPLLQRLSSIGLHRFNLSLMLSAVCPFLLHLIGQIVVALDHFGSSSEHFFQLFYVIFKLWIPYMDVVFQCVPAAIATNSKNVYHCESSFLVIIFCTNPVWYLFLRTIIVLLIITKVFSPFFAAFAQKKFKL